MGVILDSERCKGCLFCILSCPKKALYLSENINKKGYKTAQIHKKICIKCGICYLVCPDNVIEILSDIKDGDNNEL